MDNMLYIVAGLVLVLLIAILVLRRNKAERPAPSQGRINKDFKRPSPLSADRMQQPSVNSATKFDDITIAQRFVDQQRYDKAVEAIERGLMRKPHDEQLSLKLLSIYATTNELGGFNRVYDDIVQYNSHVKPQADELKASLMQDQTALNPASTTSFNDTSLETDSFDFQSTTTNDLNTDSFIVSQDNDSSDINDVSKPSDSFADMSLDAIDDSDLISNDHTGTGNESNDIFELTLDDLDSSDFDTSVDPDVSSSNTQPIDESNDLDLDPLSLDLDLDTSFDFSENFELSENAPADSLTSKLINNASVSKADSDDDMLFDFDLQMDGESDLSADTSMEDATFNESTSDNNGSIDDDSTNTDDIVEDEFVLDFSDLESHADADRTVDTYLPNDREMLSLGDNDTLKTAYDVENSSILDNQVQDTQVQETWTQDSAPVVVEDDTSSSVDAPLLFDDHTPIADDFDETLLTPAALAPVQVVDDTSIDSTEPTADLMSRFAADFDFVKTLDTNQVTLDLAAQYVRLGEYDSAKRLLNEVVAQGNSDQQSQAQMMLERTA
ncbi:FimV/HubP family polar landmark protein [Psychrobacter sp. DM4]|uniref:FimV/HubP family polar landmark protein n=1 Tax=Psychrobacter sp. DM4 TaxID=3440637 RepID=UPI003F505DE9